MTDKPISFTGPMVRAILEGRKTQTRRAILPKPWNSDGDCVDISIARAAQFMCGADGRHYFQFEHPLGGPLTAYVSPYAPGDRLWLREAWRTHAHYDDLSPAQMGGEEPLRYEIDNSHQTNGYPAIDRIGRYRHGRFMPRWASRLTLIVEDVKVERLQDISEDDALAEGAERFREINPAGDGWQSADPRAAYRKLWNSINAKRPGCAWADNPWIAAITFRTIKANIDNIEASHGR